MPAQNGASTFTYVAAIIAIFVFGIVILLSMVHQSSIRGQDTGFIRVDAVGYAYGTSDQATVSLLVNGSGSTSKEAVSNLASTLSQLNATLLRYVDSNVSRIQTQSINVYYDQCTVPWSYTAGNSTVPSITTTTIFYNCTTKYVAQETLLVTIAQDNTSQFVGNVSSYPNVLVNYVNSGVSAGQATALRNIALKNALSNATQQAFVLANGGANITVLNISVSSYYAYPLVFGARSASAAVAPAYYPGRYQVQETINAVFSYTR